MADEWSFVSFYDEPIILVIYENKRMACYQKQ